MKMAWIFACVALLAWGCTPADKPEVDSSPAQATEGAAEQTAVFLCGHCGQIKGSADCCVEGAKVCDKCGLVAGSPGCCKIKKGVDVELCRKCGQIAGSEACCQPGAVKCEKCGLDKGSPGCCKIGV